MMLGVNYVIYDCCFVRLTPGVSLYQSLTLEENIVAVITQEEWYMTICKGKLKSKLYALVDYT